MSLDRRTVLALSLGLMAACGFTPVHRAGSAASGISGQISLPGARNPNEFAFRERMRRKIGSGGAAADLRLVTELQFAETAGSISQALDITRLNIRGTARYTVMYGEQKTHSGTAQATASFDATADPFATRQARMAAETRLAEELAERVANALFARADQLRGGS